MGGHRAPADCVRPPGNSAGRPNPPPATPTHTAAPTAPHPDSAALPPAPLHPQTPHPETPRAVPPHPAQPNPPPEIQAARTLPSSQKLLREKSAEKQAGKSEKKRAS